MWPRREVEQQKKSKKVPVCPSTGWMMNAQQRLSKLKKNKRKMKENEAPETNKKPLLMPDLFNSAPFLTTDTRNTVIRSTGKNQDYLQRIQSVLSTGKAKKDVAPVIDEPKAMEKMEKMENSSVEAADLDQSTWTFADEAPMSVEKPKPVVVQQPRASRINTSEFRDVSNNFVKLHMRKRFKGRTGKPKKLPSYLRSRGGVNDAEKTSVEKKKQEDIPLSARTGIDVVTECLEAEEKTPVVSMEVEKKKTAEDIDPPKCNGHGMSTRLLVVKKAGKNRGRQFFACPRGFDEGKCDYFMWADEHPELAVQEYLDVADNEGYDEYCKATDTVKEIIGDASVSNITSKQLTRTLRVLLGHADFREGQLWAIQRTLSLKSSLVILPTGQGKSLCYQLPSLLLPGLTLVISPLISLMSDQLRNLPKCLPGATLSGQQSGCDVAKVLKHIRLGQLKVLFISPEKLVSNSFQRLAQTLNLADRINFACIDEAHCISEWSHNFRPSYLRVYEILTNVFGVKCILGLTATASMKVVNDISTILHISNEGDPDSDASTSDELPSSGIWRSNWKRTNLQLCVQESTEEDRHTQLFEAMASPPFNKGSTIVYVHQKWQAESVATLLKENSIKAAPYHAGMDSSEREKTEQRFMKGTLRVIVATIAFGMGLDKKNVRGIIHFHLPSGLDNYVQEIGRAGRDGKRASCLLLCARSDFQKFHSLAHSQGTELAVIRRFVHLVFGLDSRSTPSEFNRVGGDYPFEATLPKSFAEKHFDMNAAVIETLLTMLEQHSIEDGFPNLVRLKPSLCATCRVRVRRSSLARICGDPFMQTLLTSSDVERTEFEDGYLSGTDFAFNLLKIGHALTSTANDTRFVVQELRRLQHDGQIKYELEDYSFHFIVNKKPESTTKVIKHLFDKAQMQEYLNIERCIRSYQTLSAVAVKAEQTSNYFRSSTKDLTGLDVNEAREIVETKSEGLIDTITDYFEAQTHPIADVTAFVRQSSREIFGELSDTMKSTICRDLQVLLVDDRILMNRPWLSARVLTRILHGIQSPRFPSSEWRDCVFWGKYSQVLFEDILELAVQEIRIKVGAI